MTSRPQADTGTDGQAQPLFLLAMDHRDSLARSVYGIDGTPTSAEAERISAGKHLVYRGLVEAVRRGADPSRTGVLVDERYGAAVAREARAAGLTLAMPVERSGQPWFTLEYGTFADRSWLEHVDAFDPDHVKVLIRDNPGFGEHDRRTQQENLAKVSQALRDVGRSLLLELLVPATPEQQAQHGDGYDDDLRPQLTEQVISDMQQAGVEPGIWKIEGLDAPEAAERIVAVAQQGGRGQVRCIVLGRDAPPKDLDRWLRVAASVDGFHGFAIGRSIWEEPLAAHLAGTYDDERLIGQVADNYLHYVAAYTGVRQ
jgi:myo-inositol catabolism protein IolC